MLTMSSIRASLAKGTMELIRLVSSEGMSLRILSGIRLIHLIKVRSPKADLKL